MGVIDDVFAKDPETRSVEFCTDAGLRGELQAAAVELDQAQARLNRSKPAAREAAEAVVAEREAKLEELLEKVRGHLIRFTFAAIGSAAFQQMKRDHPPQRGESDADWHLDTFAPALIAASCVRIEVPGGEAEGLTEEEAQQLWTSSSWNEPERAELFHAAASAQLTRIRHGAVGGERSK